MRMLHKVPLALALIAIPVVALAHPGKDKDRTAKFDSNGDGALDATEREAMMSARKARHADMLARFDVNKDGTLDDSERAAKKQAMADAEFARLDVNKDGSISRTEFAAGMRDHGGRGRGGHGGRHGK